MQTNTQNGRLIFLELSPYLAQWLAHEQQGIPIDFCRGSVEREIMETHITTLHRGGSLMESPEASTPVHLPVFKHRNPACYNALTSEGFTMLKKCIRNRFVVQLFMDLHKFGHIGKRKDNLIYDWMEAHGIECDETNWCAISKIYYRTRKSYQDSQRRLKSVKSPLK